MAPYGPFGRADADDATRWDGQLTPDKEEGMRRKLRQLTADPLSGE